MKVRPLAATDWDAVREIYRAGIDSGDATFEIQVGTWQRFDAASVRPHRRAGFRVVGTRERVGLHHGRWRDVVLVERRSTVVL